jgi:hypothetical protein
MILNLSYESRMNGGIGHGPVYFHLLVKQSYVIGSSAVMQQGRRSKKTHGGWYDEWKKNYAAGANCKFSCGSRGR